MTYLSTCNLEKKNACLNSSAVSSASAASHVFTLYHVPSPRNSIPTITNPVTGALSDDNFIVWSHQIKPFLISNILMVSTLAYSKLIQLTLNGFELIELLLVPSLPLCLSLFSLLLLVVLPTLYTMQNIIFLVMEKS